MDARTSHGEKWEDRATTVITLLPGAAPPHNLPERITSFVGRERELAELRNGLAKDRLVTLTGPGGCGKTRLALRTATDVLDRFPGGAWWVELEALGDERLVGSALAEALGVRPLPGMTALQAAGAYLASRRALVILDNCEHLLEACAEAAESLLEAAPEVVVLATSRAPLGADGETEWQVPSMSLPEIGDEETTGALAGFPKANCDSDAVSLFTDRAASARPDLALGPDEAASVATICTELDGLPLAIELAAARLRILSVAQIAAGLSDHFRMLSGGPRTASPRLQAMRASIDWSYELLSDQERVLLRRLAVFAGGSTLAAVDEVCAGDGVEPEAVLDLLASLVDQSLVIAEVRERGGVRYRLLETVRQYGTERLAEAGEQERLRGRHGDHFLALAERAKPQLETSRQLEFLELLDPEAANLAAAIEYAVDSDPPLALRLCAALYRWWEARGGFAEAEFAHSRALEAAGDREPALRALLFHGWAYLVFREGDYEAAEAHATESLALAVEVGDEGTAARARCQLGTAVLQADPPAARAEAARAAELAEAAGDDWALVTALQVTGWSYFVQAKHDLATRAFDEVAALEERIGDPFQVMRHWAFTGLMAVYDGHLVEARDAADRTRVAVEGIGESFREGYVDAITTFVEIWQGEPERAIERLLVRLESTLRLGAGAVASLLLLTIGFGELAAGRLEQARGRLEGLVRLLKGRDSLATGAALNFLADARRLLDDPASESAALEAQAVAEGLGNRLIAGQARLTLGRLGASRGAWQTARQHALAALDACVEGGHLTWVPGCLDALGEVAAGLGNAEDAARLLAAAEGARAEIGIVRVPPEEEHWARIDKGLRGALGDEAYEVARAQGAEMSTEDAVEWARRGRGLRGRPPGGWESLTPTEVRVAELVAEGLTNPQVAERMFVSPGTVKTHLSHIFGKLNVHSRAELTAEAVRRQTT